MTKLNDQAIERIARVMHEAMRAWQVANGEDAAPPWSRAPKWMRESSVKSVVWRVKNPAAPIAAQHDQWLIQKKADGWKRGRTKDEARKTHPMMVPYGDLPEVEKRKDALANAVIDSLFRPMK